MSTTTMSHPSFSIPLFAQLVRRLRNTNARYNLIAHQCRRTQRPTHHAKRLAYQAGLRIDTSKARATWPGLHVFAVSSPILDSTADSPVWGTTETETDDSECMSSLGLALRNLPEVVVGLGCRDQPGSPLGLRLIVNVDDSDARDLPVPGAPRWRSKPLPEDECGMETMIPSLLCTYDPVWRAVMATHVSTPLDVVYAGIGIAVPPRRLERKVRGLKVDGSVDGIPVDGYFLGGRWSEA